MWFIDTSSLMSIAVSPDLKAVVQTAIGTDAIALLEVVVDELDYRSSFDGLAAAAYGDLSWLGPEVDSSRFVEVDAIEKIQIQVADGRFLKDPYEHWGESVTIAMLHAAVHRGSTQPTVFLTEDHSARVQANKVATCTPMSVHRLMWERVQAGKLTDSEAARLAGLLQKHDRGQEYTAADFANPNRRRGIRRVGEP